MVRVTIGLKVAGAGSSPRLAAVWTATTPGMPSASEVSMPAMVAWAMVERT